VSSQEPSPGTVANPAPVSEDSFDEGTAVMPRQRQVLEAGRYDLHHAVIPHSHCTTKQAHLVICAKDQNGRQCLLG
jgi:hypothetical protein